MKYSIVILLMFAASMGSYAQIRTTEPLGLKEKSFNFGTIRQGRPVTHDFKVVNHGKEPLIINEVEATCGCTTPEWSNQPIAPGDSSVISVGFNAAAEGPFSKMITIHYNDGDFRTVSIEGNVYPAPATSAPLNSSLSRLKQ